MFLSQMGKDCIFPNEHELQIETEKMNAGLGWSEEKLEYKMDKIQMKRQEYKVEINNLQV